KAGMVLTVSAAWGSAKARASSPVFHSLFQLGLSAAPTNACIPGLISAVGSGNAFAGTSRGARSVAIATVGADSKAPQAIVLKSFITLPSSLWFLVEPSTCHRRNAHRFLRAIRFGITVKRATTKRARLLNSIGRTSYRDANFPHADFAVKHFAVTLSR